MHRAYRQLLLAFISLISIIITCNKCREREIKLKTWTPEIEQQLHDVYYAQAERFTTNREEKTAYADCCMSKMKALFPNGISGIGAAMSDSVKVAVIKMGSECSKVFKSGAYAWQADAVEQLKLTVFSYPEIKMIPEKMKQEYVDCIAYKIIAKFPNGLEVSNTDSVWACISAARKHCLKLLVNKYSKSKISKLKLDTAFGK